MYVIIYCILYIHKQHDIKESFTGLHTETIAHPYSMHSHSQTLTHLYCQCLTLSSFLFVHVLHNASLSDLQIQETFYKKKKSQWFSFLRKGCLPHRTEAAKIFRMDVYCVTSIQLDNKSNNLSRTRHQIFHIIPNNMTNKSSCWISEEMYDS